mmetsp:Transcript_18283/g.29715  ORF Transcript_18283/g.29715 Transcript_18283/m.29715 type:complete len:269 (+) Transcript_18283:422-1228(+)
MVDKALSAKSEPFETSRASCMLRKVSSANHCQRHLAARAYGNQCISLASEQKLPKAQHLMAQTEKLDERDHLQTISAPHISLTPSEWVRRFAKEVASADGRCNIQHLKVVRARVHSVGLQHVCKLECQQQQQQRHRERDRQFEGLLLDCAAAISRLTLHVLASPHKRLHPPAQELLTPPVVEGQCFPNASLQLSLAHKQLLCLLIFPAKAGGGFDRQLVGLTRTNRGGQLQSPWHRASLFHLACSTSNPHIFFCSSKGKGSRSSRTPF